MHINLDDYRPQDYRPCVGIAVFNKNGDVWLGKRFGETGPYVWQMPQGGMDAGEVPEQTAQRELFEETGITQDMVTPLGEIKDWLYYDFPEDYQLKPGRHWLGQRQRWFAYRFHGDETKINLKAHGPQEFSEWKWHPLSDTPNLIVPFKREVYDRLAAEFEGFAQPAN